MKSEQQLAQKMMTDIYLLPSLNMIHVRSVRMTYCVALKYLRCYTNEVASKCYLLGQGMKGNQKP